MTNRRFAFCLLCVSLIVFPLTAQQQQVNRLTATIEGRTLTPDGQPLRKTALMLNLASGGMPISTTSDENGRYIINGLEPGRYVLMADHPGYLQTMYGANHAGGALTAEDPFLNLAAGQHMTGIDVQLRPEAIIFGKVTDEDGDPMSGVRVIALVKTYGRGSARLTPARDAITDDKGGFRITELSADRYFISAVPLTRNVRRAGDSAAGQEMAYTRTYYPDAPDAEHASAVDAPEGRETNINLRMLRVPAFHVRGRIDGDSPARDSSASFASALWIYATPAGVNEGNVPGTGQRVDADGSFDVPGLTPGIWNITAKAMVGNYVLHSTVTIGNHSVDDFRLTEKTSGDIKGTVRIVPAGATGAVSRITLEAAEPGLLSSSNGTIAQIADDGSFTIRNVPPLEFRVSATVPPEGYLKSATLNGHDALHSAADMSGGGTLSIVVSMTAAEISGNVTGADGERVPGTVVVVPEPLQPGNNDLYHRVAAKADGTFTVKGLAPGKYKVYAWEELEPGAQRDSDYMKSFEERGVNVSVEDNDRKSVKLLLLSKERAQNILRSSEK